MKKILKWTGIILGSLLLILAISAFYLKTKAENLANRTFDQKVEAIVIPTDSLSLVRGKLLSVGCRECHGHDLAGKDLFNDPMIGYMSSPNITRAKGSATEHYSDIDYVRTFRHCLNPQGKALTVMPSESIGLLSDEDLGCLIAYLKTLDPIEKTQGPTNFTLMAKIMSGAGLFGDLYPYDIIDHNAVHHLKSPPKSIKAEYGAYMAGFHGCKTCHGTQLAGGISPDPSSPPVPNITPGGNVAKWTVNQFRESMRTGKTPENKTLDAKFMPWPGIGVHDDEELEALYNYLKSLPATPTDAKLQKKLDAMNAAITK
ncbi:MAG: hypothetical protein IPG82_00915 [Saprospiraceae bacterium]|nr:hypothetical protein [Saprospiraceae bacterium]